MSGPGARPGSEPCAHCGLPARARGERAFCCTGCWLAFHLSGTELERHTDRLLARVVLSAFLAMGVMVFSLSLYGVFLGGETGAERGDAALALEGLFRLGALALSAPVLLLLGAPLCAAVRATGRWLSADALILAGASAAWIVSVWNTFRGGGHVYYETATAVLVLVGLGRWLDARARERARAALVSRGTEVFGRATRVDEHGAEESVSASALRPGDRVRVRPGEHVPVDGEVVAGRSFADVSSLTGEPEPKSLGPGDSVLAGARLVDGALDVRARAVSGARLVDAIERLLADAVASRPRAVRLADRVSSFLLPAVLVLALGTAAWHWGDGPERALLAALSVVLISCPCALGIATPLAFWAALGRAWREGAIVRGGETLERLARARRVLFDKTGTLTEGRPRLARVTALHAGSLGSGEPARREALRLAAALELGSEHPLGRALREAWTDSGGGLGELPAVEGFRAEPGVGVSGRIGGRELRLARARGSGARCAGPSPSGPRPLVGPRPLGGRTPRARVGCERDEENGEPSGDTEVALTLHAGDTSTELARFTLRDTLRPEAADTLRALRERGLELGLLSGDSCASVRALSLELGIAAEGELLPHDKARRVRTAAPTGGARGTVFVGDGLNDSAALAAADVGIAFPSGGAPALGECDVGLLTADLALVPRLLELARAARRTASANLAWAIGYNALGLALAASGRLTPIFAASAMVASSALVVLNAARLGRGPAASHEQPRRRGTEQGNPARTTEVPAPDPRAALLSARSSRSAASLPMKG